MSNSNQQDLSRRDVVKSAAALAAAGAFAVPSVHAAGSDVLKIGLIGCGRRGVGAMRDCLNSAPNLQMWALGDVFKDRVDGALNDAKKLGDKCKVDPDRCFTGFDAYKQVIASGVDIVLLCAPPGFRPPHLRAAVEAGKHVFMEKPAAVDPAGVRSVIESGALAEQKKLSIVAGTQRRHQFSYRDILKRIQDGEIGQVVSAEAYWLGDYSYYAAVFKKPEWSDMEWQLRNWNYFAWLSGDIIVEQHVHNLDVVRWAVGANPVKCIATGSRAVRTGPEFGHIYDNFNVSFEFPSGVNAVSMCRQMSGASNRVCERIHGSKASTYTDQGGHGTIKGSGISYSFSGPNVNPYVQEHTHLIQSIREGKPINEARQVAESTMMAVMGRISAYTGREVGWDWVMKASKESLMPEKMDLGPLPVPPVAVPGQTKLF